MAFGTNTVMNLYENVPIADGLQIAFQNELQQSTYFNKLRVRQIDAMTYINNMRGSVKISGNTKGVMGCNYLSFNNPTFDGKPFYAKIYGAEQVGASTVKVYFEIDWWQTFMFDGQYRSSTIEREHLSADLQAMAVSNPYRNDIPELLTTEDALPVERRMEVEYKQPRSNITPNGRAHGPDDPAINPDGAAGLVHMVPDYDPGGFDSIKRIFLYQIATFKMEGDRNDSTEGPSFEEFKSLWSWVDQPTATRGYIRPFYLCAIREDGMVYLAGLRGGFLQDGDTPPDTMVQEALNWLTYNGVSSQIIGTAVVPEQFELWDITTPEWSFLDTTTVDIPTTNYAIGPVNPKLFRNPYRYLRVIPPNGDEAVFERERFGDPSNVSFAIYMNADDKVSLSLAALNYNGDDVDFKARVTYAEYPEQAYSTDGYLTAISAKHNEALANNYGSAEAQSKSLESGGGKVGAVARMLGGALKQGATFGADPALDEAKAGLEMSAMARDLSKGGGSDNPSALAQGDEAHPIFEGTRGAYIANNYHAGNSVASLGTRLDKDYFEVVDVMLRPAIVQLYDDFFTAYGYTSNRLGIPRVINWTKNGDTPHFVSHDGLQYTYCKTANLKVYGIYEPAARFIADLFNNGCRFIKGDV